MKENFCEEEMLKIEEFFDMDALEKLRLECFGEGLDCEDDLSWHIALKDGDKLFGAGRLFREKGAQGSPDETFRLDKVCVSATDGVSEANFREMIFRTLMLKCTVERPAFVAAPPETEDAFYEKFGFAREGNLFRAQTAKLVFPKLCKECGSC